MSALKPMLVDGNVQMPKAAPWLEAFLAECAPFPNGKYDDRVDTVSQMLHVVKKGTHELRYCSRYERR